MRRPLLIRKRCEAKTIVEPGQRWVIARISTTVVDRDGDVMLPSGLDMTDFSKNPVVLFGHDSNKLPVGKALDVQQRPNDVLAKIVFADRPSSLPDSQEWPPDTLHELFKQGILKAFSVGFTIPDNGSRPADQKDRARFGEDVRRIVNRWRLVELSIVPLPANQEALATAVSKGFMHRDSWVQSQMAENIDGALDMADSFVENPLVLPDPPFKIG